MLLCPTSIDLHTLVTTASWLSSCMAVIPPSPAVEHKQTINGSSYPAVVCRAQVLLAAAQSPLLAEKKLASVLIPRLCNSILTAPSSSRHVSPAHYHTSQYIDIQPGTIWVEHVWNGTMSNPLLAASCCSPHKMRRLCILCNVITHFSMLPPETTHSAPGRRDQMAFLKRLLRCAVSGEVVGGVPWAPPARAGGDAPPAVPDRRAVCD